jgi:hypothetical protein
MTDIMLSVEHFVTPAKAGVHLLPSQSSARMKAQMMDSRLRGNDEALEGAVAQ